MDKEGSTWLPLWLVSREVKGSKHFLVKETRSYPSITPSTPLLPHLKYYSTHRVRAKGGELRKWAEMALQVITE